jgi:hypothetical protein
MKKIFNEATKETACFSFNFTFKAEDPSSDEDQEQTSTKKKKNKKKKNKRKINQSDAQRQEFESSEIVVDSEKEVQNCNVPLSAAMIPPHVVETHSVCDVQSQLGDLSLGQKITEVEIRSAVENDSGNSEEDVCADDGTVAVAATSSKKGKKKKKKSKTKNKTKAELEDIPHVAVVATNTYPAPAKGCNNTSVAAGAGPLSAVPTPSSQPTSSSSSDTTTPFKSPTDPHLRFEPRAVMRARLSNGTNLVAIGPPKIRARDWAAVPPGLAKKAPPAGVQAKETTGATSLSQKFSSSAAPPSPLPVAVATGATALHSSPFSFSFQGLR